MKEIFYLLTKLNHYNQSDLIEIAKGKNELPTTWEKCYKQIVRKWKKKK